MTRDGNRTFLARVEVSLKPSVNDPQGSTVRGALASLGFDEVSEVRVGKYMELRLTSPGPDEAARRVEEMCRRLLANPVIEQFHYTLEESEEA